MIFDEPLPFKEAVQSRAVRAILPTTFRTELLSTIPAELRERAFFSAGVTNAEFLQSASDKIDELVAGTSDRATLRTELKRLMGTLGAEVDETDLTDLRSDARLNLILDTNLEMAQGYGHYAQGQDEAILDQWPAQELIRVRDSKEPRDWESRWTNAGGTVYPGGRMIALKNDPIWTEISRFGQPYAPFDFNSGMDLADVDRDEAISLGLIDRDTRIEPQKRSFTDGLQASFNVGGQIVDSLQKFFGGNVSFTDGVLRWLGGAS